MALAYEEIDQCLLEACCHAFADETGLSRYIGLVYKFQNYLTQMTALQTQFDLLLRQSRAGYEYFFKTIEWLTEQVEHERENRARHVPLDLIASPHVNLTSGHPSALPATSTLTTPRRDAPPGFAGSGASSVPTRTNLRTSGTQTSG